MAHNLEQHSKSPEQQKKWTDVQIMREKGKLRLSPEKVSATVATIKQTYESLPLPQTKAKLLFRSGAAPISATWSNEYYKEKWFVKEKPFVPAFDKRDEIKRVEAMVQKANKWKLWSNESAIIHDTVAYLENIQDKLTQNWRPKPENEYIYMQISSKALSLAWKPHIDAKQVKAGLWNIVKDVSKWISEEMGWMKDALSPLDPTLYIYWLVNFALSVWFELMPGSSEKLDFWLNEKTDEWHWLAWAATLWALAWAILVLYKKWKIKEATAKLKEFAQLSWAKLQKIWAGWAKEVWVVWKTVEAKAAKEWTRISSEVKEFYKSTFSNDIPASIKHENPVAWIDTKWKIFYNKAQFESKLWVKIDISDWAPLFDGLPLKNHPKANLIIGELKNLKSHEVTHRVLEAYWLKNSITMKINWVSTILPQEQIARIIDWSVKLSKEELVNLEHVLQAKIPGFNLLNKAWNIDPKFVRRLDTKTISKADKWWADMSRMKEAAKTWNTPRMWIIDTEYISTWFKSMEESGGFDKLKGVLEKNWIAFPDFQKWDQVSSFLELSKKIINRWNEDCVRTLGELFNKSNLASFIGEKYQFSGTDAVGSLLKMIDTRLRRSETLWNAIITGEMFGKIPHEANLANIASNLKLGSESRKVFDSIQNSLSKSELPSADLLGAIWIDIRHGAWDIVKRWVYDEAIHLNGEKKNLISALKERVRQISTKL
ncbi:MAG: hypothetical protein ACD_2C00037G0001 [uncultured bacterium (gcode 4)]|uniref:Uncharacterized protein n=1 Tax=uncultured bacterium (gcode 4) TaxID=1234023 RepID=K2G754_9BACT|nr:MAG: hypothetical protein ACD_2C00037G0001 [uncultured bacterium (gcode 4)]